MQAIQEEEDDEAEEEDVAKLIKSHRAPLEVQEEMEERKEGNGFNHGHIVSDIAKRIKQHVQKIIIKSSSENRKSISKPRIHDNVDRPSKMIV